MTRRRILPLVMLVLLGSAVLGVIRMRELSFWFDEISSIQFATGDLVANLQRFADQMPAYFIVLRGWIILVGQSEVAGRWLSVLFGLLTLTITFRLVWRYASLRIATLTLITLASSAVFLRYYREMRPYMFLACISSASMWFYLEWLRCGRRRDAAAYVIVTSVMLYTHFFTGLLVAAQGLYFLITMRPFWRYRRGWITLGLHALTGLALLPYLGFYFSGLNLIASRGKHPAALTNAQAIETMARALTNDSLALFAVLILLAILAARKQRLFTLALIWLGLPVIVVLLVHALVIPVLVNPRYLLFVWPALAILVAFGIEALNRRSAVITVGVLIAVGVGQVISNLPASFPGVLTDHPWREMFTVIRDNARSSDVLLTNMIDPVGVSGFREPIGYYFSQYAPQGMASPIELDVPPFPTDIAQRTNQATGAWLMVLDGEPNPRGQAAITALKQAGYTDCRIWAYPHDTTLTEWQRIAGPYYRFGEMIDLQRTPLNRLADGYRPGDTFDLALGFRAAQPPPLDYSVGVYMMDSGGQIVSQQDGPPANYQTTLRTSTWQPGESFCDVHHLVAPQTPGTYTVRVAIYYWQDQKRLTVSPAADGSDTAAVFAFTVQ